MVIKKTLGNLTPTADVNFTSGDTTFVFKRMRCKDEYLRIIDNYFSMFGYQVNELKVPQISTRRYWNFVKIGQNEIIGTGSIPKSAFDIINKAFRRGITIWHYSLGIVGNYALDNTIV